MNRLSKQVSEYLPIIRKYFRLQPIEKAWLFGSCSRGEETQSSDIDLLVEYTCGHKISLLDICRFRVDLGELLHRSIDIVERGHLLAFARESAENDKILIYERES